ncbi:MAG: HAMP domain-containing sensor histidine kinase [Hyphomicrobiaceae bacterium]
MMSLQLRLLLLAVAGIAAAMVLAALLLASVFDSHVRKRYVEELDSHLHQLASLARIEPDGAVRLRHELYDASFQHPLSGRYWQVNEGDKPVLRSKSLWDATLAVTSRLDANAARNVSMATGPKKQPLVAVERLLILPDDPERKLHLIVAGERRVVDEQHRDFLQTGLLSLALIGGLLALASWMQVRAGLAPLRLVGRELDRLRRGEIQRLEGRFPVEIADFVAALNRLLATQAREVERGRANAGKLGHALKTPLAVLLASCRALRARGEAEAAREIESEIEGMNAQISRVIAAARSVGPRQAAGTRTVVAPLLKRMVGVMQRLPGGSGVSWDLSGVSASATLPIDPRDLEEILGNLLDNGRKWARRQVRLVVDASQREARIQVDDDGPGIPEERWGDVLSGGYRLDRTVTGTGIGLAIASDVAGLHGGRIELGASDLGGTRVALVMPLTD